MGQFLYFRDGGQIGKPESFFSGSLSYAYRGDKACTSRDISKGPSGESGALYCYSSDQDKYEAEKQTWIRYSDYWVGIWNDSPPGESDLRRDKMIDGYPIKLQNGDSWTIPRARTACDNSTTGDIERSLALDAQGKIVAGDFLNGQGQLNDIAQRVAESFLKRYAEFGLNNQSLVYEDGDPITVLSFNYHLSTPEVVLLQLWNYKSVLAGLIMLCLIDYYGWSAIEKKTASGT